MGPVPRVATLLCRSVLYAMETRARPPAS